MLTNPAGAAREAPPAGVREMPRRAILRRAFDLGVAHFDLANNYGPR
jgi:aryl-alcohol dehydrogenase-like predicted oxidoreductase